MQECTKQNLIQAYNNEDNFQLKRTIARALGMFNGETPLRYLMIELHDPDMCNKHRNRIWKEIIDRWSREDHKTIDINNLRYAMKAINERLTKGSTREILKQLFRSRVLN